MGKAAKAHRAKVLKRNQERKHVEKKMKKEWEAAFEEQMAKMKEQFASMSGMSEMSGISEMLGMSEMMGNDEELRETFPLNIEGHNMPLDIDETKEEN